MKLINNKRLLPLVLFATIFGTDLNGQYWEHGTRWVYRQVTQSFPIFQEYEVVADTLINGESAQKITIYSAHFTTNATSDTTTFFNRTYQGDIFTKNVGDSIYWYDPLDNQFEFLFDNSPEVGDQWTNEANSFFGCGSTNLAPSDQQSITGIEAVEFDEISFEQAILNPGASWTLGFSYIVGVGPRRTFLPIPGDICSDILINNDLIGLPSSGGLVCFSNPTLGSVTVSDIIDNFNIINYDGCGDFTISTDEVKEEKVDWLIYPNPSSSLLFIERQNHQEDLRQTKLEIYNQLGQKIYKSEIINNLQINLTDFMTGVYYMKIGDLENEGSFSRVFLVQHE